MITRWGDLYEWTDRIGEDLDRHDSTLYTHLCNKKLYEPIEELIHLFLPSPDDMLYYLKGGLLVEIDNFDELLFVNADLCYQFKEKYDQAK